MKSLRINAVVVGILFILATVFGVIAVTLFSSALTAADYLSAMVAQQDQILAGTILYFLMALACAGIGLALYPVLHRYNEGLAIGAAGFRVFEGVMQTVGAICMICLLALSREFVLAGSPQDSYFQTAGAVIRAASDWIGNSAMLLIWCTAAMLYYTAFYRYRLVPRWLSAWGLIGILLVIITSFIIMVNPAMSTVLAPANFPIAIQEMVFAAWLIAKGYTLSAVPVQPTAS